jgi:hypothetical protein
MRGDAVRYLAHGVCWQVRIAKPMAGRRAAGPAAIVAARPVPGMQRIRAMVKGVHAVELAPRGPDVPCRLGIDVAEATHGSSESG